MKKRIGGTAARILLFLTAGLLVVSPVQAHGVEILRSDPADGAVVAMMPSQVRAWFSAELATDGSFLEVVDAAGTQVDLKDGGVDLDDVDHASMKVSLPAGLPDGVYIARWQAMLPDGDSVLGTFQFTVGAAPYPAGVVEQAPVQGQPAYPAGEQPQTGTPAGNYLKNIFANRSSLVGAGIGGLAILLGLLLLVRRISSNRS